MATVTSSANKATLTAAASAGSSPTESRTARLSTAVSRQGGEGRAPGRCCVHGALWHPPAAAAARTAPRPEAQRAVREAGATGTLRAT